MSRSHPIALLLIILLVAFSSSAVEVLAQSASASPPPYPSERSHIEIMFAPDSQVRLRAGVPADLATNALAGVDQVLAPIGGVEWSRICDVPEAKLDELQAIGKANTGNDIYNLNNIYRLRFDDKAGAVDVWRLAADLEALPGIMLARPVPLPMEPPNPPDYDPSQNYNDPASSVPSGIDARYAWTLAGGTGAGITVCDLEYSWNYNHADVTKALGSQINVNVADPFSNTNHGTAVIGELVSDDNLPNWGTKGSCYGANLKTCGTYYGLTPSWNVPGALAVAIANLNAGDIILLEQQWDYAGGGTYVPVEWWLNYSPNAQTNNGVYAAIVTAVANGIHVVEAGGNGNIDTDLMTWFGDSGAIIVGAGGAYPGGSWPQTNLERLSFSSYGSRFNLQGWGENVVTTGYGNLYSAEGVNKYYTNNFSGTSSASPIVAGAVACCQGYYIANVSATPLAPGPMRTLLVNTGTPQFFGLAGAIGPRPDCYAAIQNMVPAQNYEYGDAPELALAYPATGTIGQFPTCVGSGPPGSFVQHGASPWAYFGPAVDYEPEGNAGNCPFFPPYDADECWNDGDAGLLFPPAYTISPVLQVVPCNPPYTGCLGLTCANAQWGANLDIQVVNNGPTVFVNVLMDWDQNGWWAGGSSCPTGAAPEHVLVDFPVPGGYAGPLSGLVPPGFLIGPNPGYVWTRFSVTDMPVGFGWSGAGIFAIGESCDYLLCVEEQSWDLEYGDAPEGALAYPAAGTIGFFPTCTAVGPAGFVSHMSGGLLYFGPTVDLETDGNAGNCPLFPPYDADECWGDGDAGLLTPGSFTIDAALNVVPCPLSPPRSLGTACTSALWGPNVDIQVTNSTPLDAYVNVLMDWDQNGTWQGASQCPTASAPEHVLVNFLVPAGFLGPLSALGPPGFLIGPNSGYVWSRFTVSDSPVLVADWDGSGAFQDGETCDYLLQVDPAQPHHDYGDAPEGSIAYPLTGILGQFPTCVNIGPAAFVAHQSTGLLYIGPSVDGESEGNAGNCPFFPPYDADECWNDGDAGLLFPPPYTIDNLLNIVPCPLGPAGSLGLTCNMAYWGLNLDIQVTNNTNFDAFVNVLMDWDQNGMWQGVSTCPTGAAPEHVLMDFLIPAGFSGPLSLFVPPPFLIGPNWGHVWSRFTISDQPVGPFWAGDGNFTDGETSDYLLEIQRDLTGIEETEAPITATRLLPALPNPFYGATTIRFELVRSGDAAVGVYDVAGRRIRTLFEGERASGRYQTVWDGRNDAGERVASGMYFVRLRSEGKGYSSPLLLLR
jgi:hypothetical protein